MCRYFPKLSVGKFIIQVQSKVVKYALKYANFLYYGIYSRPCDVGPIFPLARTKNFRVLHPKAVIKSIVYKVGVFVTVVFLAFFKTAILSFVNMYSIKSVILNIDENSS